MAARFFSSFATQMLSILVGWQVYAQTHSPLALGAVGLAEAVPALSLALWAGYQVDHGDPERIFRRVLRATLFVAASLLWVFTLGAHLFSASPLPALYIASACMGAARAYYQPCMTVLLPRLVARAQLPQAAAWSTSSMQLARVLGPGVGGLLYAGMGPAGSLHVIVGLLLASVFTLGRQPLLVATRRVAFGANAPEAGVPAQADVLHAATNAPRRTTTPAAAQPSAPLTVALFEGVRYVRRHAVLRSALTLDMVCVFFGSVTAVLPIFAEQVLDCGPGGLGLLRASPALGGALASLVLTRMDIRAHAGRALLLAVAGFGLCSLAFALSRSFVPSLLLLLLSGMLDSVSVLVRQLIIQLMSPAHMRGRISAANAMFVGSSNEIGEFESGVAAAALGLVRSVLFGGCVCLAVVGGMAVSVPELRRLDLRRAAPT